MTNVESSVIKSVGTSNNDLVLEFKDGKRYSYEGAGFHYYSLLGAESAGKFFNATIKDKFKAVQLG